MKKIVFTILFATLFVACVSDDNPVISPNSTPDLTQIRIKERPGEMLEYVGKIGGDFDTALDSLRKLKNIPSEIIKEPLEVLFDYDNRLFFGIGYSDCGNYSDVLDTKGNYYLRSWYSSEETVVNQDPRVTILGEWELVKSVYGELKYLPQYEFRKDGTYTYTGASGATIEGKYSIHEESGDMTTAERQLVNYDHFLRLSYNENREDFDDWGLVIVGDHMYLTGIHKFWIITPAEIYQRKKTDLSSFDR